MAEFNTVIGGQFSARLKACAYQFTTREVTNGYSGHKQSHPVYYLYHLDIVGSDPQTVDAILSGLVNEPNGSPVKLCYTDRAQEKAEPGGSLLMWAAPKAHIGARKLYGMPLKHSKGFQGVLSCEGALPNLPDNGRKRQHKDDDKQDAIYPYFVILLPDELPEMQQYPLHELYLERLNREVSNPFLPEWSEWLLSWAQKHGYIEPLTTIGCKAHLCHVPNETELAMAISEAIKAGELYTGPTILKEAAAPTAVALVAPEDTTGKIIELPKLLEKAS